MDRIAGAYGSESVGRPGGRDRLALEVRNPKPLIFAPFFFLVFRMALFFGAAYSYYSHWVGLAWLLGIIFVHSFLDPKCYMKPNLMTAYLAFTVIFYYCRWVMGWGQVGLTVYTEDAPDWVKITKDIVWIGFVAIIGVRALTRPRFDRNMPLWFSPRGMAFVLLVLVYLIMPTLSIIYARGNMFLIILTDLRFPLEYVPIVFLLPFILRGESSIKYLRTFIPLIFISLLFLGVEMFSGRKTGFGGQGFYVRYGSIFGAPNDFGLFMMLSITFLLAFLAAGAVRLSLKIVALLVLCLFALASTVSLSAIFAMVFSTVCLVLFAKDKVKGALTVLAVVVLAAGLYFAFPDAKITGYLTERIVTLPSLSEGSAYQHYGSVMSAEDSIKRFEPTEYLVGTFQSRKELILPETYYLRTFFARGGVSLLILLSIITLSLVEAQRRYRAAQGDRIRKGLFLGAYLGVAGVAFACLFIPYLDIFPSNFYFWFLVAIIWCEPMSAKEVAAKLADRPRQRVGGASARELAPRLSG